MQLPVPLPESDVLILSGLMIVLHFLCSPVILCESGIVFEMVKCCREITQLKTDWKHSVKSSFFAMIVLCYRNSTMLFMLCVLPSSTQHPKLDVWRKRRLLELLHITLSMAVVLEMYTLI